MASANTAVMKTMNRRLLTINHSEIKYKIFGVSMKVLDTAIVCRGVQIPPPLSTTTPFFGQPPFLKFADPPSVTVG